MEIKKSRITLSVEGTGLSIEYKKSYFSSLGGTITSEADGGWRLCGDGGIDDPDGTQTTIMLTEGDENPLGSGYYDYYGYLTKSGNYTLYIDNSIQSSYIGKSLFGMDLMQYISGNYEHRISSSNVHGLDSDSNVVGTKTTQVLTSKTLTSPIISVIKPDSSHDLTLPVITDVVVTRHGEETLTNKKIIFPEIATLSPDGTHTLTMPIATDVLVGQNVEETLNGKTIMEPVIDVINTSKGYSVSMPKRAGILPVDDDLISAEDVVSSLASGTTSSISVLKYIMSQLMSSTKFSDMLAYSGLVSTGSNEPSFAPSKEGLLFVDTANDKVYISVGIDSSSDWKGVGLI